MYINREHGAQSMIAYSTRQIKKLSLNNSKKVDFMIDLKDNKSRWSAISARGGQLQSAEGGQFMRLFQSAPIKVYPNPAKEHVMIELVDANDKINKIKLINQIDQIALKENVLPSEKLIRLNINERPKGKYFIIVRDFCVTLRFY